MVTNQSWRIASLSSAIEPRLHNFNDAKTLILDICSKEDMRLQGKLQSGFGSFRIIEIMLLRIMMEILSPS